MKRVHQLGKSLDFSCSFCRSVSHFSNSLCLFCCKALSHKVGFGISTGKLLKGFGQNFSRQPFALGKRLTEGTVRINSCLCSGTQKFGSSNQGILEHLTAHTRIYNRVPVHQRHFTCGKCLRKLIHCGTRLLRSRTRHSGKVSNTLNRVY